MPPKWGRYAIFVDAGFLYKHGSKMLSSAPLPRDRCVLDVPEVIRKLGEIPAILPNKPIEGKLLRIYWYDGVKQHVKQEQKELASSDNVLFRAGTVNAGGQQKRVDLLIVTDLIDLARNGAISDAILFAGDDDLSVGVEIIQTHGVRVYLLVAKAEDTSHDISEALYSSVDCKIFWTREDIRQFLQVFPSATSDSTQSATTASILKRHIDFENMDPEAPDALSAYSKAFVDHLSPEALALLKKDIATDALPQQIDGKLIGLAAKFLGHMLTPVEKRAIRESVKTAARQM